MAFSLLVNLYKYLKSKSERKITLAILGLDNAGKTSILKQLKGEDPSTVSPTFGFEKQMLEEGKYTVEVFDLGGGKNLRRIWKTYLSEVHGIIYVLDASDPTRFPESRKALEDSLAQAHLQGKAVLFLANKQDLPSAASAPEAAEALGLASASSSLCCFNILGCSALKPDPRLREGIKWLVGQVHQTFPALDARVQREADVVRQEEARKKKEREEQARQMREERLRKQQEEAAAALALELPAAAPVPAPIPAMAAAMATAVIAVSPGVSNGRRSKSGLGGYGGGGEEGKGGKGNGGGPWQQDIKEMVLPNQIETPNRSYPSTVALGESIASPAYDGSPVKPMSHLPPSTAPSATNSAANTGVPRKKSSFSNLQDTSVGWGSQGETSRRGEGSVKEGDKRKEIATPSELVHNEPLQQGLGASFSSSQRPPRPPSATPPRAIGAAYSVFSAEAESLERKESGTAPSASAGGGGVLGRLGSDSNRQSPANALLLTEMVGRVSSRSNKIAPEVDSAPLLPA